MTRLLPLAPVAPLGCKDCAFLHACGGLGSQQAMFGCFSGCGPCGVEQGCDYTCPRKPGYWRDWAEVGGFDPKQKRDLPSPRIEPLYVPMIRHGSSRQIELPGDVCAINTFDVVDSQSRPKVDSGDSLREEFKLSADARVLLVSVNKDRHLERFWRHRDPERLAALAQLDLLGMTAPNFSFFDDAPRMHTIRNLWRIVRVAEDLADAGIAPVLHVNGSAPEDWEKWADLLRRAPSATVICKEFQTGLQDPERALRALDGVAGLQESTGRDLHLVVVGGRRLVREVARRFARFTIVDSVPFMAAIMRRRIVLTGNAVTQVKNPTDRGEALDDLLQDNIRTYTRFVALAAREAIDSRALDKFDDVEPDGLLPRSVSKDLPLEFSVCPST